jgi:hypothetical protein
MRFFVKQVICLALFAGILTGCSDQSASKGRVKVYKASGKVTFHGTPLIGAMVSFSPEKDQPAAIGRTNDTGAFTLTTYQSADGAAAGDFKVLLMMLDSGESGSTPDVAHFKDQASYAAVDSHAARKGGKATGNVLPAKYGDPKQTPLTAKVDPTKENTFTFEVK